VEAIAPRIFRPTKGRPRSFHFVGTETRVETRTFEVWESTCATCGTAFRIEVLETRGTRDNNFDLVNCPAHRMPGKQRR
jgi:hypothetical protein